MSSSRNSKKQPRAPAFSGELLDQVPPHDPKMEEGLLGSLLLDARRVDEVASMLRPEDFHLQGNAILYKRLLAMHDNREGIDISLVERRLREAGELEAVGGTVRLGEVLHSVAAAAHAAYYAREVAKLAKYRRMIHAGLELVREGYAASEPPEEILGRVEADLAAVATGDYRGEPVPIAESAKAALDAMELAAQQEHGAGLMIGLPDYDERFGGLFPGELVILAGRPAAGKTALALQIAAHVARRGRTVYFASLEMSHAELATRLICADARVSSSRTRTGRGLGKDKIGRLVEAANTLARASLVIHDRPGITVAEIRRACRRLQAKGLALAVVDYLLRITPPDRQVQRYEQIGLITDALKTLARELGVPILCLCQLSRVAAEDEPQLHHLRESGSIEQDADVVAALWRKTGGFTDQGGRQFDATLFIRKNRNGETGSIGLRWDGPRTTFSCLESW